MEEVTKTTPSKTNHRKTASSISSSGDETTDPAPINEKVWLYEENIKKVGWVLVGWVLVGWVMVGWVLCEYCW